MAREDMPGHHNWLCTLIARCYDEGAPLLSGASAGAEEAAAEAVLSSLAAATSSCPARSPLLRLARVALLSTCPAPGLGPLCSTCARTSSRNWLCSLQEAQPLSCVAYRLCQDSLSGSTISFHYFCYCNRLKLPRSHTPDSHSRQT